MPRVLVLGDLRLADEILPAVAQHQLAAADLPVEGALRLGGPYHEDVILLC